MTSLFTFPYTTEQILDTLNGWGGADIWDAIADLPTFEAETTEGVFPDERDENGNIAFVAGGRVFIQLPARTNFFWISPLTVNEYLGRDEAW